MSKEESLKDFLNTLKISFKNASMYGIEHPAFSESIDKLKERSDKLFKSIIPITIGFTSHSLFIEGMYREKLQLYQEIARIFHFRKLKKIEINEGVTVSELVHFISKLSTSPKEVIKNGGPSKLLNTEELPHIAFEELDYSELLKGTGEEIKDIWVILLQEALETQNEEKIQELAESFEKVIKAFETEDIAENKELIGTLSDFFAHLEKIDSKKYRECAKDFVQTMMRSRKSLSENAVQNLQKIASQFREKDMAATCWEEILTDDSFDSINFNIFTKLVEKEKHEGVAHFIANIFRKNESLQSNPKVLDKMEQLFSESSSPMISEIYRNTLATLLKEITFQEELTLQDDILSTNYRFMLINLVEKEEDKNELVMLLQKFLGEWEKITEKKDYECLKAIYDTISGKKDILSSESVYKELDNQIIGFIEKEMLQGELSFYFDYFINTFQRSTLDVNVYLEKIFTDGNITPYTLSAFFKFFKEYLFYFNINLEQYSTDGQLIKKMINSLRLIDTPISLVTLKNIYPLGDRRVKTEVLQAMQNLTEFDTKFLLPILKEKDLRLKAEAFVILIKEKENRDNILKKMLSIPSPFGIKNKHLLENIKIVEQKQVKEAEPYLISLSERKNFWNRKIRTHAKRILEKWNAGHT
jgi:hypothetical protein